MIWLDAYQTNNTLFEISVWLICLYQMIEQRARGDGDGGGGGGGGMVPAVVRDRVVGWGNALPLTSAPWGSWLPSDVALACQGNTTSWPASQGIGQKWGRMSHLSRWGSRAENQANMLASPGVYRVIMAPGVTRGNACDLMISLMSMTASIYLMLPRWWVRAVKSLRQWSTVCSVWWKYSALEHV